MNEDGHRGNPVAVFISASRGFVRSIRTAKGPRQDAGRFL
jgi:hypothetical protein